MAQLPNSSIDLFDIEASRLHAFIHGHKQPVGLLLNTMFFDGAITPQQKLGKIVCLPKHGPMLTPADRRPITLLNSDYKLLTCILARRLRPIMDLHLKSTQYCGVTGNTIFDAVATVRDVAAYAENTHLPLSILTLDFQYAFCTSE